MQMCKNIFRLNLIENKRNEWLLLPLCLIGMRAGEYLVDMMFGDKNGAITHPAVTWAYIVVASLCVLHGVVTFKGWKWGGLVLISTLLTILMLELGMEVLLRYPIVLRGKSNSLLHQYYKRRDRNIIQCMPICGRYDPDLFYTLRPGRFRFKNREFDVEFYVNSLGVRDDDASEKDPEAIVVGDSFAMGWGVQQDQTFAQILETNTGMTMLNAAISSYGTVRELEILKRISLKNLRYLIIQYYENDYFENVTYAKNHNYLPIRTKQAYKQTVMQHTAAVQYFLGKHIIHITKLLFQQIKSFFSYDHPMIADPQKNQEEYNRRGEEEVDVFLNVLANSSISPVNMPHLKIIVFEIPSPGTNTKRHFISRLKKRVSNLSNSTSFGNIVTLNLSEEFTLDHYFILDDHLTEEGHKLVAERLLPLIN